jgi:DNA topoisomerase-1
MITYNLKDAKISEHLKMLLKLSGDRLFQYIDDENILHRVYDFDLNKYIQDCMGDEFTIKDFRTYAANYHFIIALIDQINKHSDNIKKNIITAIEVSAKHLSHTKNISKKSYIMAFCVDLYIKHPEFFVSRKLNDPKDILIDVLTKYNKKYKK